MAVTVTVTSCLVNIDHRALAVAVLLCSYAQALNACPLDMHSETNGNVCGLIKPKDNPPENGNRFFMCLCVVKSTELSAVYPGLSFPDSCDAKRHDS